MRSTNIHESSSAHDLAVPAEKAVPVGAVEVTANGGQALFAMMSALISGLLTLQGLARSRAALHLAVLALRHQLRVLERSRPRQVQLGIREPLAMGVALALVA